MTIKYDSGIVNKFADSLTDDVRVVTYDCHMFIVQATTDVDISPPSKQGSQLMKQDVMLSQTMEKHHM
jgi:hypothetical protein